VREQVAQTFAADGGIFHESIASLATACDIVISVVVNAAQTEDVLYGKGQAAKHMKAGSVFVMCSTVDPHWSIAQEAKLAESRILYIDAPISGGAKRAHDGEITVMAAGNPAAGNGSKVKIINQLLAGVHIAAAAEAMALGLRENLDPQALYEVITNSAGNSWMFENRMTSVLSGDYTATSAVDIFVKDLGLVLDVARASKFPLPLSSTAHQMFMQASTAGFAKEQDSAVVKIFPGIHLPAKKS
jgi:L-threonate 2-dehydrogenase